MHSTSVVITVKFPTCQYLAFANFIVRMKHKANLTP